jgi:hypothetical protein
MSNSYDKDFIYLRAVPAANLNMGFQDLVIPIVQIGNIMRNPHPGRQHLALVRAFDGQVYLTSQPFDKIKKAIPSLIDVPALGERDEEAVLTAANEAAERQVEEAEARAAEAKALEQEQIDIENRIVEVKKGLMETGLNEEDARNVAMQEVAAEVEAAKKDAQLKLVTEES